MLVKKDIEALLFKKAFDLGYKTSTKVIPINDYYLGIVGDRWGYVTETGLDFFLRASKNKSINLYDPIHKSLDFNTFYAQDKGLDRLSYLKIVGNNEKVMPSWGAGWFSVKTLDQAEKIINFLLPHIIKDLEEKTKEKSPKTNKS